MQEKFPLISVIIPVKNEGKILGRCLGSLRNLDYPGESLEVIIADGLSVDNTREVALKYGAQVVVNEKEVVVSGRNRGFEKARGEIIAFTDADCVFDRLWLRNALKYFDNDKVAGIGGATFSPDESSDFEKAIDYFFHLAEVFQSTAHRHSASFSREVSDIPGCNAIYRRQALSKIMPVDEGLLTAEDAWMNYCLRSAGYKLKYAPDVILWHYRRSSPKRFARQIYRFAVGRLQVGKRCHSLLNIFHIICGLGIPFFILSAAIFYFCGLIGLFFKLILIFFTAAILSALVQKRDIKISLSVPLAMVIFMAFWSIGFLREFFFPLKDIKGK